MHTQTRLSIFTLLLIALISACSKPAPPSTVQIQFNQTVDSLELEQYDYYLNAAENNYNVMRLRYFVSNIYLIDSYGDSIRLKEVHYVDIDKEETLSLSAEEAIPNRKYTDISFTFGLNENHNISNAFLNESFHSAMVWPDIMGGGYHYMKIEGYYQHSDGTDRSYNLHSGKWEDHHKYINIKLPLNLYAKGNDITLNINMDINQWLSHPNTYNFEEQPISIMNNLAVQQMLHENGQNAFTVSHE